MKKLLLAVATLTLAATAHAGLAQSSQESSKASQDLSTDIWGSSQGVWKISKDGSASMVKSAKSIGSAFYNGSKFVITNSYEGSKSASKHVSNGSKYVFTKSGKALEWTSKHSVQWSKSASENVSKGVSWSARLVEKSANGSSKLVTESGKSVELVLDESGKVFSASANSVVVSVSNSAKASGKGLEGSVMTVSQSVESVAKTASASVSQGPVKSFEVSREGAEAVVQAAMLASGNFWNALTAEGEL